MTKQIFILLTFAALILFSAVLWYAARADIHRRVVDKAGGPEIAFIGDSLTYGGGVWDWRLGSASFKTANFGLSGANIRVISWVTQARVLPSKTPRIVCLMAGSNDAPAVSHPLSFRGDAKEAFAEYRAILQALKAAGVERIVVTSAPPQDDPAATAFLRELNTLVRAAVEALPGGVYVDLWPAFEHEGRLRPELTTDGVHFTSLAYSKWAALLRPALAP